MIEKTVTLSFDFTVGKAAITTAGSSILSYHPELIPCEFTAILTQNGFDYEILDTCHHDVFFITVEETMRLDPDASEVVDALNARLETAVNSLTLAYPATYNKEN